MSELSTNEGNKLLDEALEPGSMSVTLLDALRQSVALQSHYAVLLNMHDGGHRLVFDSADDWIARLNQVRKKS